MYLILFIVPPITAPTLTEPFNLMNRSFTINWTITNSNNIDSYTIKWTNLRTGHNKTNEVLGNRTSYEVTGLNGVDNYNVSVTAENKCGKLESDPITVYGKNIATMYLKLSVINDTLIL